MVYGAGIRETSRDALSQLRVTQEAAEQKARKGRFRSPDRSQRKHRNSSHWTLRRSGSPDAKRCSAGLSYRSIRFARYLTRIAEN
jgi:hypothetical protein